MRQSAKDRVHVNEVVKEMARNLTASLRDIDLVGRSGEVEFCLILPSTPKKEGALVVKRITRTIKDKLGNGNNSLNKYYMHISVGMASFPEDGASSADLINAARIAISHVDAEERGKSVLPLPEKPAKAESRLTQAHRA
jgi:diguanylate cyclase (GGDEF)-like protein